MSLRTWEPGPHFKQPRRVKDRKAKRTANDSRWATCKDAVWARDRGICRAYGTRVERSAVDMLKQAHFHHITFRSQGGKHNPANVVLLSADAHEAIHARELFVAGDANRTLTFTNHQGKSWTSEPPR